MLRSKIFSLCLVLTGIGLVQAQPEIPAVVTEIVSPPPRVYASYESLLWRMHDGNSPPLATRSVAADAAILGNPSTSILFGGEYSLGGLQSGHRATFGANLDPLGTTAVEYSFFYFAPRTRTAGNFTNGPGEALGIPFLNQTPDGTGGLNFQSVFGNIGAEDAIVLGAPELFGGEVPGRLGHIQIQTDSRLWGMELNTLLAGVNTGVMNFQPIVGFRHLNLHEGLNIRATSEQQIFDIGEGEGQGRFGFRQARATFVDDFRTKNYFYGGTAGWRTTANFGRVFFRATTKISIGVNRQIAEISGFHSDPDAIVLNNPSTGNTGLFTARSNIGTYSTNVFAVVPEMETVVGINVTRRLTLTFGFNTIYLSNTMRPGGLIDRNLNLNQTGNTAFTRGEAPLDGPAVPAFNPIKSTFSASGVSFGVLFQY